MVLCAIRTGDESISISFGVFLAAIDRFITTLGKGEYPPAKGSLGGLINRSSLMDVPFRGMQFQNELIYLAALEHPSATVSDINIQSYRGRDTTYYLNFSAEHVRRL